MEDHLEPEMLLIQKMLQTGEVRKVLASGLKPEHFLNEDAKHWYDWLLRYYMDAKHYRAIPTERIFRINFPMAILPGIETRTTVSEALQLVKQKHLQLGLKVLSEQALVASASGDYNQLLLALQDINCRTIALISRASGEEIATLSTSASSILNDYAAVENGMIADGIAWPWPIVNDKAGPIEDGNLIVLHGRPKQLKTWIGLVVACFYYQLSFGGRVFIYSCEMPRSTIMRRCAAYVAGIDYHRFTHGHLDMEEREKFFNVMTMLERAEKATCTNGHKKELIIEAPTDPSILDLQARIEQFSPDLVLIDAVQHLGYGEGADKYNIASQTALSHGLKKMAVNLHVPILAIHQSNREKDVEYMADIAFSDSWGRDPDVIIKVLRRDTPDNGRVVTMLFQGAREFDLTAVMVHAKPAYNFGQICEFTTMAEWSNYDPDKKSKKKEDGKKGKMP